MKKLIILILTGFMLHCATRNEGKQLTQLNTIAESYVKLVLEIGQYDRDFVDAYYGPEQYKPDPDAEKGGFPYDHVKAETANLLQALEGIDTRDMKELIQLRKRFLQKQLIAVGAKADMISGKRFTFDEESSLLYDAVAPHYSEKHFAELVRELDQKLPGQGDILTRLTNFRQNFIIPKEKLKAVFEAAIQEGRRRTLEKIPLPADEHFIVEYVTDKPWGAYNWYKGNHFSVIQFNTDLPAYIERAVDLACHEGYPGHHVYNTLLEHTLYKGRGWVEFSVYPLFSPQSLIAEGTANFGIDVAFTNKERIRFEKEVLFPLAGLDTSQTELYYEIFNITSKLGFARNEANRNYLDGKLTREERVDWLMKYALKSRPLAEKSVDFVDQYRSYIINYNVGQELVENYIEGLGGTEDNPDKRWELFRLLLSGPQTPSGLLGIK